MGACHSIQFSVCGAACAPAHSATSAAVSSCQAVFDFFADQEDSEKHQPLFNKEAKKKAKLVLEAILRGELSDPPGAEWYVRKTNQRGEVMVDRDGLWLYRCFRGTNLTESMHQSLTTAFGHTRAGPE